MQASFFKRFGAYFLDVMIVTLIASIVAGGFTSKKYEEAFNKAQELEIKYLEQEITFKEYFKQSSPIYYDMEKSSIVVSIITLASSIAYFIVFQYLNKGQTIGKKLLKIRVQENGEEPSLKAMIIRTIIVDSILSATLGIILLYILNKKTYYLGYNIVSIIELIFVFITAMFILYKKDKRGLHDIMAHTEVIDERGN